MRAALAIVLLLGACGQHGDSPDRGASQNQIERLSTPVKQEIDPNATARIGPLRVADLAPLGSTSCAFGSDGRMLLAITPSDAIARVAGDLRHFAHSSPAGPTGGFFEDRNVSISVGRTGEVRPGEGAAGRWPGRMTVTNRRTNAQVKLDGVWRCGT